MEEACAYLGGISRQTMYNVLREGQLSSYYIGARRYCTKESLDQFIDARNGLSPEQGYGASQDGNEETQIDDPDLDMSLESILDEIQKSSE